MLSELVAFVVHLRLHYQLLVLSGGYLMGGLFAPSIAWTPFMLMFFNVHVLLNGGVTAYNSYFDDDDGPIGGVEHPPQMKRWMHPASLVLQGVGLVLAYPIGVVFMALWILTMVLSVLYSAPPARWKGHPILSLVAVGVGTGTNTFWMGYLAAGGSPRAPEVWIAGVFVAVLLLSLYPVSQIYQREEDRARNDLTFAAAYGLPGVRRIFAIAYPVGLAGAAATLALSRPLIAVIFAGVGALGGLVSGWQLFRLTGAPSEYRPVMRLKYSASLSFVIFLVACLFITSRSP